MAISMSFVLVLSLMCVGQAVQVTQGTTLMSHTTLKAMKQAFFRAEDVHQSSMVAIANGLSSSESAVQLLHRHNLTTPSLLEITSSLHTKSHLRTKRAANQNDGAKKLLNEMIYESMSKYDSEIAKCTDYYTAQCAAMNSARGDISAANYMAANSRALILDAQAEMGKCEVDIPNKEFALKNHKSKCSRELHSMRERAKIVEEDIKVITTILTMTECKKTFVQKEKLALLQCKDPCTQKTFVTFNESALQDKVSQLQSSSSHGLIQDSFKDLFQGIESLQNVNFLQLSKNSNDAEDDSEQDPKTKFNNPPVPRTAVPRNPCSDPDGGAPNAGHKGAAKCTISKSPECYKLQERFLLIQSGIQDERDDLLQDIANMDSHCKETAKTMDSQIQHDKAIQMEAQTKLAAATEKEANAGESARQTARENEQLNADLVSTMKSCSTNYIKHETELCGLKKIRGELYKMGGKEAFFTDCQVSEWDPSECSKKCDGGDQQLSRSVMVHPSGGAKCLPLSAEKKCNTAPCPTDCKMEIWGGWSKCSAECGGGVMQRVREVKMAMKHNGDPCPASSETKPCNIQSCEQDCELSRWTQWSHCSKKCDGGTNKRQKYVMTAATGQGKCADKWSKTRLQYRKCNMNRCMVSAKKKTLSCDEKLDIVFLLDGSGSLGQTGWDAEIKAAQLFVDAFSGTGAQAQMSVILYSGPRTWGGVYKCFGRNSKNVDMENVCKIQTITHFTKDMKDVKTKIAGLKWPKGSTLTSLALMSAASELSLGRKDANSVVVVITDGRPLSYRNTGRASRFLRKKARVLWVPVTRNAPLRYIKSWATRRWQENVVSVKSFADLEKPELVTHAVANICPTAN